MPYVDPYWDEYKEKMESKVKQLEADLKTWKNQDLLEQCNRQSDEIERLRDKNARLVELHNKLADRLNEVDPDNLLYGKIPVFSAEETQARDRYLADALSPKTEPSEVTK